MNHGWQSEPTDGWKGGWSCVFGSGCNGCSGHLVGHLNPQLLDVARCSAAVVVVEMQL